MKAKAKMKLYTVRLPEAVIEELRKAADKQHITAQCFVINAVKAEVARSRSPEIFEGSDI